MSPQTWIYDPQKVLLLPLKAYITPSVGCWKWHPGKEKSAFLKCHESLSYCSNDLECLSYEKMPRVSKTRGRPSSDRIVREALVKNSLAFQPHAMWMAHTCYRVGGRERPAGVVGCEIANGFHQGCPRQRVSPRLPLGCWGQSASSYVANGNLLVINFKSCPQEGNEENFQRGKSHNGPDIQGS